MPHTLFSDALQPLLPTLISTSNGLDEAYSALEAWARLCGEIIVASNLEELKAFCELLADEKLTELGWTFPSLSRTLVWKQLVQVWRDDRQSGWEGAILLLSTPFAYVLTPHRKLLETNFLEAPKRTGSLTVKISMCGTPCFRSRWTKQQIAAMTVHSC